MSAALLIRDLAASVAGVPILKGVDLEVPFGEIHALMGPNGSGKSTLCHVLSGRPGYEVSGSATLDGSELLEATVDERARLGLFQAFQYPVEVPGVSLDLFLSEIAEVRDRGAADTEQIAARLDMERFLGRSVNEGLSGGEMKRSEMFQLAVLDPKVGVLDEIDSGLDIDAVREVAEIVEGMRDPGRGLLLITHYSRIFRYMRPDRVHVMLDGRVAVSGGPELAGELEEKGYDTLRVELGLSQPEEADPFS